MAERSKLRELVIGAGDQELSTCLEMLPPWLRARLRRKDTSAGTTCSPVQNRSPSARWRRSCRRVCGREIQFVDVPDAAAREAMLQAGMPEFIAEFLVMLFGELRRGVATQTTDTVRSVTGRQPCSFAEFARDYAAAFAAPISV